jgi:hypothetical protein
VSDRPAPPRWVGAHQIVLDRQVVTIDGAKLANYEPQEGEHVPSLAAVWLGLARGTLEMGGVLTHVAWCASCRICCIDRRPSPARVRQWCDAKADRRRLG